MKKWYYFLIFALLLIPITNSGFAETIKVQIPTGSSTPLSDAHFIPQEISVRPGDRVQWGNTDTVFHTVTSGSLLSGPTGLFDSGHLKSGDRFEVLLQETEIGEIEYFCTIHPWMGGIVNVVDLEAGFDIYHNVGAEVSDLPIDIAYQVQRNLVKVDVDPMTNSLTFTFAGKITNDSFVVILPEALIKNPQSVWMDEKQTTDFDLEQINGMTNLTIPLEESTQIIKLMGTQVIGEPIIKEQILINQILAITDKTFYEQGDSIVISGEIKNPVQLLQVSIDVSSPEGQGVFHSETHLINGTRFTETIPTIGVLREFGEYSVKITGQSAKSSFVTFEYGTEPKEFESPKQQIKTGMNPSEILCKEGFHLLEKVSNGKPVCLTKSTAEILVQRGWAKNF